MTEWSLPPPAEEVLWTGRGIFPPAVYEMTTLRALAGGRTPRELPLIGLTVVTIVRRRWWYNAFGIADLTIRCGDESLTFHTVRRVAAAREALQKVAKAAGVQLVEAYRGDESEIFIVAPAGDRPPTLPDPPAMPIGLRAFVPVLVMVGAMIALFAWVAAQRRSVSYPANDAIYPNGRKQSEKEIIRFMEQEVLPFARASLGPIVGGVEKVKCETCHGENPDERGWKMPAVRALPDPQVLKSVSESLRQSDALVQTAVYGYLATEENQKKMRWMREVVLPGMAKVLRRPAYDFTQPYEYNRQRFAFGCYHCHQLDRGDRTVARASQ